MRQLSGSKRSPTSSTPAARRLNSRATLIAGMTDTHGTGEAGSDLDLDAIRELARQCGWTFGEFVEFYLA